MIHLNTFEALPLALELGWQVMQSGASDKFRQISQDSRTLLADVPSLFFAVDGPNHNGHHFLHQAKAAGAIAMVVEYVPENPPPGVYLFKAPNGSIKALQALAAWQRRTFKGKVVGITGSNGKTIVKEWAWRLISPDFDLIRSPGSYNSAIGVPLSLWPLASQHQVALIEAGISHPGEMDDLAQMMDPELGVWTHMGNAHLNHFPSEEALYREKAKLFSSVKTLIFPADNPLAFQIAKELPAAKIGYGQSSRATLRFTLLPRAIRLNWGNREWEVPWVNPDSADAENLSAAWALAIHLGCQPRDLLSRSAILFQVSMRLETLEGLQGRILINDAYSADLNALELALKRLQETAGTRPRSVVLSDFAHLNPKPSFYLQLLQTLKAYGIQQLVALGKDWPTPLPEDSIECHFFETVDAAIPRIHQILLPNSAVLIKGARVHRLERLLAHLQYQHHGTQMEIYQAALVHNLAYFRRKISKKTKLMVMVKAAAYGTGQNEIPSLLAYYGVDYLAVAYPDEGLALRKQGILLPVLVLNPGIQDFDLLQQYRLEPEIYSLPMLKAWMNSCANRVEAPACHIKWNTGMNRLGFDGHDLPDLLQWLKEAPPNFRVASVFSHLAASDEAMHDGFTQQQIRKFQEWAEALEQALGYPVLKHISNSGAIQRFPEAEMDMVRLGIALYGIGLGEDAARLEPAVGLKTKILQVRKVEAGQSVGYGRAERLEQDETIAVASIGYADGFPRSLSSGMGKLFLEGIPCPVVGRVCMDLTMIRVGHLPFTVEPGMDAWVFGRDFPLQDFAKDCNSIPYEVISTIHHRVPRVYIRD